jgi:predicted alpha/beta hydrolase family esterase
MPVQDTSFENRIFFAREVGNIDQADAEAWTMALRRHAQASPQPIVALVDALSVTSVTAAARKIFAQASQTPNLLLVAVATKDLPVTQTARVIGLMGKRGATHVFASLEEAREFAQTRLGAGAAKR